MIALAKKRGEYIDLFFRALVSPKDKALKAAVAAEDALLEVDEIIHFRKLAYTRYGMAWHGMRVCMVGVCVCMHALLT